MKLKYLTALILLGFFIFMTTVFTTGLLLYYNQGGGGGLAGRKLENFKGEGEQNQSGEEASTNSQNFLVLDEAEVSKHSSKTDCYEIINDNVYDLTTFIDQHPGGSIFVSKYCGKNSTANYNSKDRNPAQPHSRFAQDLLRKYYIGPLGMKIDAGGNLTPASGQSSSSSLPAPSGVVVVRQPAPATQQTNTTTSQPTSSNLVLDSTEVAKHSTLQNCWLIISGKVYDVTSYIYQHPGGVSMITNWCGKDGTTAFQTRGGSGSHSNYANNLLNTYLIGTLGSSVQVANSGSSGSTTTNPTLAPVNSGSGTVPTTTQQSGTCATDIPQSICTYYSGSTVTLKNGEPGDNGSWEGEVYVNGSCRHVKTNSSGAITPPESC